MMRIVKVISGGQTGADRAALDAARRCGVPHGGWCPCGRRAEDGEVPSVYRLRETESRHYPERTRANAAEADLTLIFSHGPLTGGSLLTRELAGELNRPCVHVDLTTGVRPLYRLNRAAASVACPHRTVLNVAGPRASGDPLIYRAVYREMIRLLRRAGAGGDRVESTSFRWRRSDPRARCRGHAASHGAGWKTHACGFSTRRASGGRTTH